GRLRSDWVAAFDRNRWPPSVGIGGRFASDSARNHGFDDFRETRTIEHCRSAASKARKAL
ncbi:hypothetical protein ABIC08_009215, partial [Bradyrhizobium sp. RT9b]|uniref:hypothetical protein n=1 Tax=Bradyrhizobium sp. RT9b TaxID=3156385 RepID=UPI00339A1AD3